MRSWLRKYVAPPLGGSYKFSIDGNLDGVVNRLDLADFRYLRGLSRRQGSW